MPIIYPKGYDKIVKVYSGNVAGKPRGLLPNVVPAVGMFYVHTILRNIPVSSGLFSSSSNVGFWTIQIRESGEDGARILFEQSVEIGVNVIGEFGGLITGWYIHPLYTYKFKTRICNGEYVTPVIEPMLEFEKPLPPVAPAPEVPDLPRMFNVKVTTLSIKVPDVLPARANSFSLLYASSRWGEYQEIATGLDPATQLDLAMSSLGISSSNASVAATEIPWFKIRADGDGGRTESLAIRDTWTISNEEGTDLVAGYEGWKHVDFPHVTSFAEQSYVINETVFDGNFGAQIGGDVVLPPYKCTLPVGAHLVIISDYWVGQIRDDNIYYSLSIKPGGFKPVALYDGRVGTVWALHPQASQLLCDRSRRMETHALDGDGGLIFDGGLPLWANIHRDGATLFVAYQDNGGLKYKLSDDEAITWGGAVLLADNVTVLGSCIGSDGGALYFYGKATANDEDHGIVVGDIVRLVIRLDKSAVKIEKSKVVGDGLPETQVAGLLCQAHNFYLTATADGQLKVWRSTDEMSEFTELPSTVTEN